MLLFFIFLSFADLPPYLHQRIQISRTLWNQNNLFSPQFSNVFFCQRLSAVSYFSTHFCIIWQNPQDSMCQQTFAGAGRADYCHHFSCVDCDT